MLHHPLSTLFSQRFRTRKGISDSNTSSNKVIVVIINPFSLLYFSKYLVKETIYNFNLSNITDLLALYKELLKLLYAINEGILTLRLCFLANSKHLSIPLK